MQGELHRRMFWLPPPTSPFIVLLPSAKDCVIVPDADEGPLSKPGKQRQQQQEGQGQGQQEGRGQGQEQKQQEGQEQKQQPEAEGIARGSIELEDEGAGAAVAPGAGAAAGTASGAGAGTDVGAGEGTRAEEAPGSLSRPPPEPVYIKGCTCMRDFLYTRGWTAVQLHLQDCDALWRTAEALGLVESQRGVRAGSAAAGALKARFVFKPAPPLEQWVDRIERRLAEDRCGAGAVDRCGAGGAESGAGTAGEKQHQEQHQGQQEQQEQQQEQQQQQQEQHRHVQLRLRALEPGCGSGRNLAWLLARRPTIQLADGTLVTIQWDVVGVDLW